MNLKMCALYIEVTLNQLFFSFNNFLFIYLLNQKSAVTLQNMSHTQLSPSVNYQEIPGKFPNEKLLL